MCNLIKKSFIILLLIFVAEGSLYAQNKDSVLNQLSSRLPVEKVYIHYDKEYYVAGETIWFKAYLYSDGKPSGLSSNFYLQFLDNKNQVIVTKHFPVLGAIAKGIIEIPDSLPQGNYYIRALTPTMLNSDEDFVYHKNIYIFNPQSKTAASANSAPSNISLQFFPECGQLVHGILTNVAFKATDQWGTPFDAHGIIKTNDGTTVAPFHTYHDGIGKLTFKPIAGKKYVAELETPAGVRTYNLPEVQQSGVNLKVQDEKGGKKFQLSRSETNGAEFATISLVAQINNHVVYETEIAFEDYPSVIGHLVTDSLPSGILHFTVFNKDGIPLAERLTFVDNKEYKSNGEINAIKVNTEKRGENSFEINFEEAIQRSCSVSVIEMPSLNFKDEDNILSRFLLTADLKGKIYNPAWYFKNDNDSSVVGIDNLLLTHGWSRFNWKKILNNDFPITKYKDQNLLTISGRVLDEKTKEPLSIGQLNIFMEAQDSSTQTFELPLDENGSFKKESVLFYGKAKLFYTYLDRKNKQAPAIVELDANDSILQIINSVPEGIMDMTGSKKLGKASDNDEVTKRYNYAKSELDDIKELERVTVQAISHERPIDKVNEKYATGVFKTPGKIELDNINEPGNDRSMNAVDYIKNRIRQLEIEGGTFVNRKNFSLLSGQKWQVGVFIDENPANLSQLRNLRVDDLALVKFYEAGFVGVGSGSPGGALAVYRKERSNKDERPDKFDFVQYKGYSISKEFFNPNYTNVDPNSAIADNRTTLYWNPDFYTDKDSTRMKVNFFNNDFSKKFKVVIEGFDAEGKLLHIEKQFGN